MFNDLEFKATELWSKLSPDWRKQIEAIGGVDWDSQRTDIFDKMILLQTAVQYLKEERNWQRKEALAKESVDRLVAGLSTIFKDFSEELREGYTEAANIIRGGISEVASAVKESADKYNASLEKMTIVMSSLKEEVDETKTLQLQQVGMKNMGNYFDIGDCVYQHPEFKTPTRMVYTTMDPDGIFFTQCAIAAHAHNRTFLGLQFLNKNQLKKGGCPLYDSRGIVERFFPHHRCPLANGGTYRWDMKEGKSSIYPILGKQIDKK